jgi:D-3-phosphoglycerate dehydrogenase / 2-oxoglutarate reductase
MSFRAVRLNATTYPVDPCESQELAQAGAELICLERADDDAAAIESCDALLVVSAYVQGPLIDRLQNCRTIARLGAGTDRIDIPAATRRGIVVSNVPDFCQNEQADHTMTLLLAMARRLPFMVDAMRQGNWSARGNPEVHRIAGQTLGLIGFGQSAQAVARRAASFGLRQLGWARNPQKHQAAAIVSGVELVPLEQLLAASDFISLHLPLTDETRHFLSAERLRLLKPTAVLINASRGAVIDEAALIELLRASRIGGAALDVFETIDVFAPPGPPPSHPLLELDNVLATPHCAGSSVESTYESKLRGARHVADVLLGRWPPHIVNVGVVPRWSLSESPGIRVR